MAATRVLCAVLRAPIRACSRAIVLDAPGRAAAGHVRGSHAPSNSAKFMLQQPKKIFFRQQARHMSASQQIGDERTVPFNLADIGEGIAEVEVLQWFVKEGDKVKAWDRICEVQSDKATVEITSRWDGEIVKIYHKTGGIALVGKPLIDIRMEQEAGTKPSPMANGVADATIPPPLEQPAVVNTTPPPPPPSNPEPARSDGSHNPTPLATSHFLGADGKPLATPAVRHMAKENGIDLFNIRGSGRDGRVMKHDILAFLSQGGAAAAITPVEAFASPPPPQTSAPAPPRASAAVAHGAAAITTAPGAAAAATTTTTTFTTTTTTPLAGPGGERVEPVRGYMRTMIKTMQAQTSVPHMGLCEELDVNGAVDLREAIKPAAESKGVKLSLLPIIIKAMSHSLNDFPEINARLSADLGSIIYPSSHNIGVAIETANGLVVPNIKNCERLSILDIAREMNRLVDLAKAQKLSASDLSGGNFTISNIGAIGGTTASPILVPNESVIVALGAIRKLPRYDSQGNLVPRLVMNASYAGDHRLLQGSQLARFSNRVKGILADPAIMMMDMR